MVYELDERRKLLCVTHEFHATGVDPVTHGFFRIGKYSRLRSFLLTSNLYIKALPPDIEQSGI